MRMNYTSAKKRQKEIIIIENKNCQAGWGNVRNPST
jgi:hypothetical protein